MTHWTTTEIRAMPDPGSPEWRDQVRAKISDAYYDARNAGRTMEDAADAAADAVVSDALAALEAREQTVTRARLVADHWRKGQLMAGEAHIPARLAAHPLCMVLAALDGETRPEQLGITPGSDEWYALRELRPEGADA